jgi:Golgi apparatus protein 1
MKGITRATGILAALCAAVSYPAGLSAQSELKDRVAAAIEAVQGSCAGDINRFCGSVTRGEGRLLLCMQAHDDQLSWRCQFALYRASRNLDRALDRVERIADACWNDIETHCKDLPIGQCVMEKAGQLSPSCQTVVTGIRQVLHGLASLKGMPAFSADDRNVGDVVEVVRGPDGKVEAVHVEVGRFLGIGDRTVKIDAGAFEELGDRIRLRITGEAVRSLPEVTK